MRHIFRPLANLTGLGAKLSDKERYSASGGSIAIVYVFGLRTLNERRRRNFERQLRQQHGNSPDGVAYLAGQFLTPFAIGSLLAWSFWRRSPYLTGTVTLLVAASSVGITNLPKVLDSLAAIESKAALRDVSDPSQIEDVIKKNPSNSVLQLLEVAYRAASDTSQVTQKLFDEIEPSSLANCGRDRAALC